MQKILLESVLDSYFDEWTMSVHIKEFVAVVKKKGWPWQRKVVPQDLVLSDKDIYALIDRIFVEVDENRDGFLEIDKKLFKIVQLGPYRIVIVYPPLSDGLEMTVVKPVKTLTIEDYNLPDKVMKLLEHDAKGVLISWAPGSWKTTFAQAVLEMHLGKGKITKTLESPRDLLVSDEVVQYSFSYGSHNDLRDILLLSRPDYTVYDELRNVDDFLLFKDLRLTGIWLLWVIHATRPIDSIQRFLWHVELGIVPQMIDTVIFIDKWSIGSIYQLSLTVKVPAGMASDDLARPVIQVFDFFDQSVQYEMYSFWEQIVVMPVEEIKKQMTEAAWRKKWGVLWHAKQSVQKQLDKLFDFGFLVSVRGDHSVDLYIPETKKWVVIGKQWSKIQQIEKNLDLRVNVKSFSDLPLISGVVDSRINAKENRLILTFSKEFVEKRICLLVDDMLIHQRVSRKSTVTIDGKWIIRKMQKFGYVVVDLDSL